MKESEVKTGMKLRYIKREKKYGWKKGKIVVVGKYQKNFNVFDLNDENGKTLYLCLPINNKRNIYGDCFEIILPTLKELL